MSEPAQHAIAADFVFDGAALRRSAAVIIEGARIRALVPRGELPAAIPCESLPDGVWLAPGFIDVQVNGGGDVLFNDAPGPEGIRAIAAAHRQFGTTALCPTLISDAPEKMRAAISAAEQVFGVEPNIVGIHLEGPFLSPQRPGVHDRRFVRAPTAEDRALLVGPRSGVTVVTLAPEEVPAGFVSELTRAGVRVCIGHSIASYAQTRAAMAEGLSGFTHLFNAMPGISARAGGPVAAVLEASDAYFGMIVDGIHVEPAVLRLGLRGMARPMLVTDAMPPVGGKRTTFTLYGEKITVHDGRCTRKDGMLAGAILDMASAVRNCVSLLGVSLETALRFASLNPAAFLGLDHSLGRLAGGCRADMVAFDPADIRIVETWVAGKRSA